MILAALAHAGSYDRFIDAEERDGATYQHAYAALLVKAVRLDADVRAREAEVLTGLGATPPVATDDALTVVFGAYTHWKDELAFSADGSTPWVLRAWSGDTECKLLTVTGADPSAWERALYPFLTRWDTLFTARFDSACGARDLRVEWTGPRGRVEVRWDG